MANRDALSVSQNVDHPLSLYGEPSQTFSPRAQFPEKGVLKIPGCSRNLSAYRWQTDSLPSYSKEPITSPFIIARS
jgi:hypothetical protein